MPVVRLVFILLRITSPCKGDPKYRFSAGSPPNAVSRRSRRILLPWRVLIIVHISCSRSVLHQTIANERSLVGLNKRICEQYDAKLATARRVGTKMAANCVVADLFGLPNGDNDALFSITLVININNEQRSTLSSRHGGYSTAAFQDGFLKKRQSPAMLSVTV